MQYVMFIVHDPDHSEEDAASAPSIDDWFEYTRETGAYQLGLRLQDREEATTVKVRAGELLVTDGPFAETKEWVAGFALIEAASLDDAIDIARRNPASHYGRIELRPLHSFGGPLVGRD